MCAAETHTIGHIHTHVRDTQYLDVQYLETITPVLLPQTPYKNEKPYFADLKGSLLITAKRKVELDNILTLLIFIKPSRVKVATLKSNLKRAMGLKRNRLGLYLWE